MNCLAATVLRDWRWAMIILSCAYYECSLWVLAQLQVCLDDHHSKRSLDCPDMPSTQQLWSCLHVVHERSAKQTYSWAIVSTLGTHALARSPTNVFITTKVLIISMCNLTKFPTQLAHCQISQTMCALVVICKASQITTDYSTSCKILAKIFTRVGPTTATQCTPTKEHNQLLWQN